MLETVLKPTLNIEEVIVGYDKQENKELILTQNKYYSRLYRK